MHVYIRMCHMPRIQFVVNISQWVWCPNLAFLVRALLNHHIYNDGLIKTYDTCNKLVLKLIWKKISGIQWKLNHNLRDTSVTALPVESLLSLSHPLLSSSLGLSWEQRVVRG